MGEGLVYAVPGFKATPFKYQNGFALVVDSLNKFISKQTCLDVIYEKYYDQDYENSVKKEF